MNLPDETTATGVGPAPPQRRLLTIQTKLSGLIVALVTAIVVPVSALTMTRTVRDQEAQLERKAQLYGALAAYQLGSALSVGERRKAIEIFQALFVDSDVAAIGYFDGDGKLLEGRGALALREAPPPAAEAAVAREGRVARALVPVQSTAGRRGTLVLELSVGSLSRERGAELRAALLMGGVALVLGLIAAWLIGRSFALRVRAVADQAMAVAAGDLSRRPLQDASPDEIGQMARAFKMMVNRLRDLILQMREQAKKEAERLEHLVAERTGELDRRNREMRLVLDNIDQGFITLDRAARVSQECSRVVESWLGPPTPFLPFPDWVFREDPDQITLFELGWRALKDGFLPRDMLLDQMPRRVHLGGRILDVKFRAIDGPAPEGAEADPEPPIDRVLVMMTDVTSELARVRAEQQRLELATVMERFARDRASAISFFEEARALCHRIGEASDAKPQLMRALHTLKGNARTMGLVSLASLCHDLESAVEDEGTLSDEGRGKLRATWEETERRLDFLLGRKDRMEIGEADLAAVVKAVEAGAPRARILDLLEACRAEPVAARLEYFADQARRIAESLGKLPIEVSVDAGGLGLARGTLGELWPAFVHVVRNAVDHGLESPAERQEAGKPETRHLALRARLTAEAFVIEVEDDGCGVDWDKVRARAQAAGLPAETDADLVQALCGGGISTRTEVTDLSGRGVGMSAVQEACKKAGGTLEIDSRRAEGTLMRFRWSAKQIRVFAPAPKVAAVPDPAPGDRSRGTRAPVNAAS